MRLLIPRMLIVLVSSSYVMLTQATHIQAQQDKKAEQTILRLEREWLDSYLHGDVDAMKRILADNFTITYSNGQFLTKEQEIANLRQRRPQDPSLSISTEDTQVRLYGETAVLTGRLIEKGASFRFLSRYTDTYVKQQGQWRIVASQLTRLPEERTSISVDPKIYDVYTGTYETPSQTLIVISSEDSKLMIQPPGLPKAELVPETENKFFINGADIQIDFTKDEKGGVTGLVLHLKGQIIKAMKVK